LRIGVGQPPGHLDSADFVLDRFSKSERGEIERAIGAAADAVEACVSAGIDQAMNRFNVGCKKEDDPS